MHIANRNVQKLLLVLIVIGLVFIASYRFWLPAVDAAYLLWGSSKDVAINTVAKPIQLSTVRLAGKSYSLGGLSIVAPWSDESHDASIKGYSLVKEFGALSGKRYARTLLLLQDPSVRDTLVQDDARKKFFEQFKTDFAVYDYLMHTTPKDVRYFSGDPLQQALLLLFKNDMIISGGAVDSFTTANGMRGFISHKDASTTVAEFFAPKDQEYTLILSGANEQELDSILNSVQEK